MNANEISAKARARFCADCNNLMYPREVLKGNEEKDKHLIYACRQPACTYKEEALDPVVYRHEVKLKEATESDRVDHLLQDPTLPRSDIRCPNCFLDTQAIYYQSRSQHKDATMILFYMCTQCQHKWNSSRRKKTGLIDE